MIKKIIMMVSVALMVVFAQADYYRVDDFGDYVTTSSATWTDPETGILWKYRIVNGNAIISGDMMCNTTYGATDSYSYYYYSSAVSDDVSGAITVPSTIGGRPVTSIGENAFRGCGSLTSVTIPDSVTSIGGDAFSDCSSLTSVTIPNSVTSISSSAFSYCSSLYDKTTIPGLTLVNGWVIDCEVSISGDLNLKGARGIVPEAFYGCSSLTSVTIPDSVTSIGDDAFRGCSSLIEFIVSTDNKEYMSKNGLLLSKDGKTLIQGVNGVVTIPDSVTRIGSSAFYGYSSLTSVTIGDGVMSIGDYAFSGCSSLTSVTIPDNVTSIGESAFSGCSSLASVTIPDSVTSIGESAFSGCSSLTSVTIPDSVTNIGWCAFRGCSSLKAVHISDLAKWCDITFDCFSLGDYFHDGYFDYSANPLYYAHNLYLNGNKVTQLVIPNGVTSIGDYAFYGCSSLTSVTIPDNVTSIGKNAFSECSSLTNVTIGDSVTSIGESAFSGCSSLTSVTIGDGVTYIGLHAFSGCRSLKDVYISDLAKWCGITFVCFYWVSDWAGGYNSTYEYFDYSANPLYYADNLYLNGIKVTSLVIPDGVTSIGDYAFYGCDWLTSVTIPNSVTSVGEEAFEGCSIKTATLPGWNCGITLDQVTNIVISAGTKIVRADGFSGCTSLESVSIPEGVTQIDSNAFSGCSSLKTVLIPDSVTYIQGSAFDGTPFGGKIYTETVKLVSQKLLDDGGSQGGSSGSGDEGGAAVTPPVNADLGYNLTESVEDRSISNVEINSDRALDEFVLKDGKVYDCVLRIVNVSGNEAKVILPKQYVYEKFRGTNPLLIPAASTNLLTITRTKADTFFISREELALEVQE